MSDFFGNMQTQLNQRKTFTANGAVAYESSGKALLDFNFATTALRGESEKQIEDMFSRAFYEEPHVAVKYLFWLRDIRGGNGERRIFRVCMKWLTDVRPEIAKAVVNLVPEYGRWDDLWVLLDSGVKQDVLDLAGKQLDADYLAVKQGKPLSIASKWFPSSNASSKETRRLANIFINAWGITPKQYRKTLSYLRKQLNLVETKMSSGKWGEINYESVPSKANLIYKDAFMRHDEERRKKYLDSLVRGEAKINSGTNQPHEIVGKYVNTGWYRGVRDYDEALEQLWKALPDVTIGNTVVVADSSGSMTISFGGTVRPFDVAMALAVYMSEHNSEEWKDKIISFSDNPQLLSFENCKNLREKIKYFMSTSEIASTNIEATMMLILQTAISNNCSQEDMPKTVLILSDCQFNSAASFTRDTLFEDIARRFKANGFVMPKIVFWNLSGDVNNTIPMQQNENGLVLCSGFSVQLMNMVMSGKTDPYEALLDTINAPRYDAVEKALTGVI